MVYTWDGWKRDRTIETCVYALKKGKGWDILFLESTADYDGIMIYLELRGKHRQCFIPWAGLCHAVGKHWDSDVDFNNLSEEKYTKLCQKIVKELHSWLRKWA